LVCNHTYNLIIFEYSFKSSQFFLTKEHKRANKIQTRVHKLHTMQYSSNNTYKGRPTSSPSQRPVSANPQSSYKDTRVNSYASHYPSA